MQLHGAQVCSTLLWSSGSPAKIGNANKRPSDLGSARFGWVRRTVWRWVGNCARVDPRRCQGDVLLVFSFGAAKGDDRTPPWRSLRTLASVMSTDQRMENTATLRSGDGEQPRRCATACRAAGLPDLGRLAGYLRAVPRGRTRVRFLLDSGLKVDSPLGFLIFVVSTVLHWAVYSSSQWLQKVLWISADPSARIETRATRRSWRSGGAALRMVPASGSNFSQRAAIRWQRQTRSIWGRVAS